MVTRSNSDEEYVLRLCDEVLGEVGVRQAMFDWLRGDPAPRSGRQTRLRVDCYWPAHALVVEYREIQHDQPVAHFDKPDRATVSGVHRGLQRRIYDQRRDTLIPAHGLRLVVIRPHQLASTSARRLRRIPEADTPAIKSLLHNASADH